MAKFNKYENLKVWQYSIALAKEIYTATQIFPKEETYGLTSQVRRAAVSIASNIAERSRRIENSTDHRQGNRIYGSKTLMDTVESIERILTALSKSLDTPATRYPILAT